MQNEFDNMTLKDFENRGQDLLTRAKQVDDYISYRHKIQHLPYRVISLTGSSAHMKVRQYLLLLLPGDAIDLDSH